MRSHRSTWLVALLCAGLAVVLVAGVLFGREPGDAVQRAELEAEFAGAYPATPADGGEVIELDLVAAPTTLGILPGLGTDVWSYDGQVPGPEIRVALGDTLRVTLRNDLPADTTIHWHGVRVPNDMDGVPGVNQPPVAPGETFVYEFTPPDAGTFWYHSHTNGSEQLERGLYGSLVVVDQQPVSYSKDIVWVLDDWLLLPDGQIDPAFNTSADISQNGRWGTTFTVNGSVAEQLDVLPGERLRLRLVNASNGRTYVPTFDGLSARVIAKDGMLAQRDDPGSDLVLAPGSRIDLDIAIPDEPGTYTVSDTFRGDSPPLADIVAAGDPAEPAAFDAPSNAGVPEWRTAADASVDQELVFETRQEGDSWAWTINGATFEDHEPIVLDQGGFTKLRFVNQTHPMHPIHLHGQFFKVLARNGAPVDEPFFRDTVLLEMLDTVDVGLVPLDAGTWVLHCHIQEHAEAGMMTTVVVTPEA